MNKTVLHLIPSFIKHSGPAKAIEIYFAYNTMNYKHQCVEIYNSSNESKNYVYCSLVKKKKIFNIIYIFKFLNIIKTIKPSIIHAHLPQANILSRLVKLLYPKIKLINTYRVSELENDNFGIHSIIYRSLFFLTNNVVDLHIAISKRIFNELITNYSIKKSNIAYVVNSADYLENIKTNYDVKEKGYLSFVSIGTLSKRKNYNELLSLFRNNDNIKLYIFGDGPEKDQLKKCIIKNELIDRAFIMGFNKNIVDELLYYDCYITLSKGEGISRALIESLQVGLPIISSDVSGVDECIKMGYNGFILKTSTPNEFKNYINVLISKEKREYMGSYSKQIYKNHDPKKHIIHMNNIYDNLIRGS